MLLFDSEVRSLEVEDMRKVVSAGDSLYIIVYPVGRGGGMYFVGRMRHPPGVGAKQVEVQIGPYGKGAGKWSLKKARDEWDRIRACDGETLEDIEEYDEDEDTIYESLMKCTCGLHPARKKFPSNINYSFWHIYRESHCSSQPPR